MPTKGAVQVSNAQLSYLPTEEGDVSSSLVIVEVAKTNDVPVFGRRDKPKETVEHCAASEAAVWSDLLVDFLADRLVVRTATRAVSFRTIKDILGFSEVRT